MVLVVVQLSGREVNFGAGREDSARGRKVSESELVSSISVWLWVFIHLRVRNLEVPSNLEFFDLSQLKLISVLELLNMLMSKLTRLPGAMRFITKLINL